MKFKTAPVSVKSVDAETGIFEALVSVFGNEDSYGDVVILGAFANTLVEWESKGDPIPVYWSHRMDDPDYNIGHVLEASETDTGLLIKAQLDLGGGKADQVHRLLKGRRVTQFSFAYDVVSEKKVGDVNELHELKLYEVGPTPIGANQETELLAVKTAADAARGIEAGLKAGRVLAQKHIDSLRNAQEAIAAVITAAEVANDQEKASAEPDAKAAAHDEEPEEAKSPPAAEEPKETSTAKTLATNLRVRLNEMEIGVL